MIIALAVVEIVGVEVLSCCKPDVRRRRRGRSHSFGYGVLDSGDMQIRPDTRPLLLRGKMGIGSPSQRGNVVIFCSDLVVSHLYGVARHNFGFAFLVFPDGLN